MELKKEVFVRIPQPDVYYGVRVNKETKLDFKNSLVNQRLENLILYTEYEVKTDDFKSVIKNELYLNEGDLLLLEEEQRGYFKPKEIKFGSIDEAVKEMEFIREQVLKIKE